MSDKRLVRSNDRMVLGVAGGMAQYFNIDPTLVRILWVVAGLVLHLPVVLVYIVLAFVMPEDGFVGKVETEEVDFDEEVIIKDA